MLHQVKINKVKSNPNNPRLIKGAKFKKLVQSIKDFPEMLKLRPIVVNKEMIVLGGNMRLKACIDAGLKEVWIAKAWELTPEQEQEFIIKDNSNFGEWDWDVLGNEWNSVKLDEWGVDVWINNEDIEEPAFGELTQENQNKPPSIKITFLTPKDLEDAEQEIKNILTKYDKAYYSVSFGEF
mgnify:CR=1 FL=1|tara:strand:+ start:60 stop:602 length:543 start_codon:yes stop_codon:yes gene_type:complete